MIQKYLTILYVPKVNLQMDEKLNWLMLAEKFAAGGDPLAMRAVARELFDLNKNSAEGPAVMAHAALYQGNLDEAEIFAQDALTLEANHLRARFVLGCVAAGKFLLKDELKLLGGVINDAHKMIGNLNMFLNSHKRKFTFSRKTKTADDESIQKDIETKIFLTNATLYKSLCQISNGLYLSGDPLSASEALAEASNLAEENDRAAELYSKHLFLRNYRFIAPNVSRELAEKYGTFFTATTTYSYDRKNFSADKKLRIGYVSPDFRQHTMANFLLPFLRDFDSDNFSVTCYQTGKKDAVTDRLKRNKISWRDLSGRNAKVAARIIHEDQPDILIDLSGHSQNSCLPIMAYKPAPVQITALGYTATTGLAAIDYFLSDEICLPEKEQPAGFTEKIIRLKNCCLCYSPGVIRDMPAAGVKAPVLENDFVTYGSFNNFAKVSDDVLYLWRAILEAVPDSILVIKSKVCSIKSGREIVRERLQKMSFPLDRIDLRPYSPDYLEQYREIDVALDTFPYTGGLTTCEALYMGVPVVSLRGKSHGARFSASILTAANLTELIAKNSMDYIKKAVHLGRHKELIAAYHAGLRENLLKSPLMDKHSYMQEIEKNYREIWRNFCESQPKKKNFRVKNF